MHPVDEHQVPVGLAIASIFCTIMQIHSVYAVTPTPRTGNPDIFQSLHAQLLHVFSRSNSHLNQDIKHHRLNNHIYGMLYIHVQIASTVFYIRIRLPDLYIFTIRTPKLSSIWYYFLAMEFKATLDLLAICIYPIPRLTSRYTLIRIYIITCSCTNMYLTNIYSRAHPLVPQKRKKNSPETSSLPGKQTPAPASLRGFHVHPSRDGDGVLGRWKQSISRKLGGGRE